MTDRLPFRYVPHSNDDRASMLEAVGVESSEALLDSIPTDLRLSGPLELPARLSEPEVLAHLRGLAARNLTGETAPFFLGGGAYRHHVPAAVDALLSRQEFFTAYTPYQPEIAQGTLQAIFEFQTLVSELAGLPVANASLYEGASATTEALLLAARVNRRRSRFLVSASLHPEYRETLQTYARNLGFDVDEIPWSPDGRLDEDALRRALGDDVAAVAVQSPNVLGVVERLDRMAVAATGVGAVPVAVVNEPFSLGLLRGPGQLGCGIVAGELASVGVPLSFGGPYLGFLAAEQRFLRALPGRLVGQTVDAEGRRGFVLTLSTREQHIRRGKATSNICTNQGLIALAATIGLSLLGPAGLRHAARASAGRARQALSALETIDGVRRAFAAPFFNEFALELPRPADEVHEALAERGVLGALPLGRWYPGHRRVALFATTELTTEAEIDRLAATLREVLS